MKRRPDPIEILSLERLRALTESGLPDAPSVESGIYFLWRSDVLLYVGMSLQIRTRISQHEQAYTYGNKYRTKPLNLIPFDRHTCLVLDRSEFTRDESKKRIALVEQAYIDHYKPRYNLRPAFVYPWEEA